MVGTGALAPELIAAHASVRPICNVLIWGRNPDKTERLAKRLDRKNFRVAPTTDLEAAVRGADIVSSATLATEPLIHGAWLQPGQHLDLVGGRRLVLHLGALCLDGGALGGCRDAARP